MANKEVRELRNEILELRMENYHLRQEVSRLNQKLLDQSCAMQQVMNSSFQAYKMTAEAIGIRNI